MTREGAHVAFEVALSKAANGPILSRHNGTKAADGGGCLSGQPLRL
jgi:hypothetical protein